MSDKNKQVVLDLFDKLINAKQVERYFDYFDRKGIWHSSPYVGMGVSTDDSHPDDLVVITVAPNSPADGKLLAGDKIVYAEDDHGTWETFDALRSGAWGLGVPGTMVKVHVERDKKMLEIYIQRGLIPSFDMPVAKFEKSFQHDMLVEWPDMKVQVDCIIAEHDIVTALVTNSGTNSTYNRYAIWQTCDIFKLQDGKIVEGWSVSDNLNRMKQQGFSIRPPLN